MRRVLLTLSSLVFVSSSGFAAYSPSTTNGWLITSGRVEGAGGALFRTDVWLFNPHETATATTTLVLHPAVTSGEAAPPEIASGSITLAPRETRFFPDVTLDTVPAGDAVVGALEWRSDLPLMAAARIYTFTPTGTYGFFLPAVPLAESMTPKTSDDDIVHVLQIYGTNAGDQNFRTNLDVTNTSEVALPVEVRVIDAASQILGGTRTYTVAPGSLLRLGQIFEAVGAPFEDGLRITVAIAPGTSVPSGGILAAAYTLDNRTQDAFAFVGQRQSP